MTQPLGKGLDGKGALVTGAGSGVARATTKMLLEAGARVMAVDRDGDALDSLESEMGHNSQLKTLVQDLRAIGDASQIVERAVSELGNLYVVAAVAAALKRQPLLEVSEEDWSLQMDTNLKASFFLNRAAAEVMKRQGMGGRIINFTSGAWLVGPMNQSDVYVISKGGIVTLTRGFARQYGAFGILTNTVSPGQIDTPMQRTDNSDETIRQGIASCPLGRMGTPEEVASVVVFLASDHASFINGATINVSGGSIMY